MAGLLTRPSPQLPNARSVAPASNDGLWRPLTAPLRRRRCHDDPAERHRTGPCAGLWGADLLAVVERFRPRSPSATAAPTPGASVHSHAARSRAVRATSRARSPEDGTGSTD